MYRRDLRGGVDGGDTGPGDGDIGGRSEGIFLAEPLAMGLAWLSTCVDPLAMGDTELGTGVAGVAEGGWMRPLAGVDTSLSAAGAAAPEPACTPRLPWLAPFDFHGNKDVSRS